MKTNFLSDLISRIGKNNPIFFKIVQGVAVGVGAVSAGFSYFDKTQTALPAWLQWLEHSEVWVSSLVTTVVAQLPNAGANATSDNVGTKPK